MSLDTLVVGMMTEFGIFRKIGIVPFHGVVSKLRREKRRLGAVARKNDIVWPLQEENLAEVGEDTLAAQVPQANARCEAWEAKNGAISDINMLSANGAAEALS